MPLRPLRLSYRPDNGLWKIAAEGGPPAHVQFPTFRLLYRCGGRRIRLVSPEQAGPPEGDEQLLAFEDNGIEVSILIRHDRRVNALFISAEITNRSSEVIEIETLDLLHLDGDSGSDVVLGNDRADWAVFQNGWQSWTAAEALSVRDRDTSPALGVFRMQEENPDNPSAGEPGRFRSESLMSVMDRKSGSGLLLGFITGARQFGDMLLRLRRPRLLLAELTAALRFDRTRLGPNQSIGSETLMLGFFDSGTDALAIWAEECGRAMNARVPEKKPVGWCSWYHYFHDITEAEMHRNIERISALRDRLPIRVIQLDDGYQRALGDWLETNKKFPSGLRDLAQRIKDAGFTAGIWTAPFCCMRDSSIWRDHPDWILRDKRGRPIPAGFNPMWRGRYYGLDMTHPGAIGHVERSLGAMAEWGYTFLKIDFVFAACLDGVRRDPGSTRAEALRRGLEAVRRVIGDSFLLGCGCPLLPAVGIVDCMRIGPDVTPRWDRPLLRALLNDRHMLSANNAIRNTITRSFMHRRLWVNDPDCLLLRRVENRLSEDETRTMASVIAASDGMVLVSDAMDSVDPDRLELAIRAAELKTTDFKPVDLFERRRPEKLLAMTAEGPLAMIINFEDRARRIGFDLGSALGRPGRDLRGRELFSGQGLLAAKGMLSAMLRPHASLAAIFDTVEHAGDGG